MLQLTQVSKRFTLHHRNNAQFQVLQDVSLALDPGQCMILSGPSGMGKSTLLKLVYANYHLSSGVIKMRQADGRMLDVEQLKPIRQLDLFGKRNKIESDTTLSESERKRQLAAIDQQLAALN